MLNILTHYIRRFLDSYRDTIRVISHFNLIKLNGKEIIFKIAFIRFVYSFSFIRNLQKTIYKNKKILTHFFKDKDIDLFNDIKQVDEKGYSKIFTIKDSLKEELLKIVFNCKELDVKKLDLSSPEIFKKSSETIDQYVTRLKKKNISKITGYLDLKTSSALKDFLTSEEILSFVKNYLNTNEISINASFFKPSTKYSIFFLRSGSPPVSLIFFKPNGFKVLATSMISSYVNNSFFFKN